MGLDVVAGDRDELATLLQTLSAEIEAAMGSADYAGQGLSVVVGFGDSLFDDRFGLEDQRPTELEPMPVFANDSLVTEEASHGDISLVINAATQETVDQVLAQILEVVGGDSLTMRWSQAGFNELIPEAGVGEAPGRNLLGFKDGTVNPPIDDDRLLDSIVWVSQQGDQPEWTVGGTYQAVRVIAMLLEPWNSTPVPEQEDIFGRNKETGAPLGGTRETDDPYCFLSEFDFESHIGRVNPRSAGINSILRRSFNYVRGDGELDQGLVFLSYQRSLEFGFIGMQRRLEGEAMEEFVRPTGGGIFFVPPPPTEGQYLGQRLIES